jgi:hypothetical protein
VSDLHDFDAAWAEEDDEPVVIRLLGEEWKCKRPSEVPASLLLRLDRLLVETTRAMQTGEVPDDFVVDADLSTESLTRALAGDDNVDAWLGRGLPYTRLVEVGRYLMGVYRGQDPGEAPAANRAQKRAAAKKKRSASTSS